MYPEAPVIFKRGLCIHSKGRRVYCTQCEELLEMQARFCSAFWENYEQK